jgi:hypothetical protein
MHEGKRAKEETAFRLKYVQEYKCEQQMAMCHINYVQVHKCHGREGCTTLGHKQAQQKTMSLQLCTIL